MKIPFDPSHLETPTAMLGYVMGAVVSLFGIVAATITGWFYSLATIDPSELAIQPLHVVLIGFIVALATFIVLILRAVWGRGIETVNRFSDANERLANSIRTLTELQTARVTKLEELSLEALRDAALDSVRHHRQKP